MEYLNEYEYEREAVMDLDELERMSIEDMTKDGRKEYFTGQIKKQPYF